MQHKSSAKCARASAGEPPRHCTAVQNIAARIAHLQGWRRSLVAFSIGALSTVALAPLSLWPLAFLILPALVWLLDGVAMNVRSARHRIRAAGFIGWLFGLGYFLTGLYWVGFAFFVEADKFAWLLPLGVVALPAGLALFHAAAAASAMFWWRSGPSRVLVLAVSLFSFEWLRGHVLTGFPWNVPGYWLTGNLALMQTASVFGVYALTLLAVIIFASPATLGDLRGRLWRRWGLPVSALILLAVAGGWGHWRLNAHPANGLPGVKLRIVQANIAQKDKWKPANRKWIFERYLHLSAGAAQTLDPGEATHLIWPESALPFVFLLDEQIANAEARAALARLIPEGTTLILGGERAETQQRPGGKRLISAVYNSLFVLDARAGIKAIYDKVHLVPFGEYLPFQATLEAIGIRQLTNLPGGFTAGQSPLTVNVPGAPPFRPLICYEIIFPDEIIGSRRPQWLLNITNDAWFGRTAGPYQHFQQARVRAVELGLPVVRAANTGISAVIDPLGRVRASLPLNVTAAIDAALPAPLPSTLYARHGTLITIFAVAAAVCGAALLMRFDV